MINFCKKKLTGYWDSYQLQRRKKELTLGNRQQRYLAWIKDVNDRRPQVYLSANLHFGGVRNHIHAIHHYCRTTTELVPNEEVFPELRLGKSIREQLVTFIPDCLALHTHVLPWAIEWGQNAQAKGIRWIHTFHLNYFPEHGKTGLELWQQEINDALLTIAPQADVCLSVARWQQAELEQEYGIESYYLPNGVDVRSCDQAEANRFIEKTGCKGFVLYVGRHDPVKNPAAFVQLAASLPDQAFVMIGKDLSQTVLLEEYGQETPANLTVFGAMEHDDVQDAIAASIAVVVTSYREGLPTLVLEAMTQSKPIVVPDEQGCCEAIHQGKHGFIYEPDNIQDLVHQTKAALQDTDRCRGGRDRVLREYDWQVIARVLDEIYQEPDLAKAKQRIATWQP